jgi:hypothetical protein
MDSAPNVWEYIYLLKYIFEYIISYFSRCFIFHVKNI